VGKNGVLEHKSGNISETRYDRGNVTIGSHQRSNFCVAAIFLLPVSPLRPLRRSFLPYFCPYSPVIGTRWYRVWIEQGTSGLSSFKPCANCWIVQKKSSLMTMAFIKDTIFLINCNDCYLIFILALSLGFTSSF